MSRPLVGSVIATTLCLAVSLAYGEPRRGAARSPKASDRKGNAPALLHKNGTTQRWLLVRLAQSSQGGDGTAPGKAP